MNAKDKIIEQGMLKDVKRAEICSTIKYNSVTIIRGCYRVRPFLSRMLYTRGVDYTAWKMFA